jgi:hypothetical protein
MKIINKDTMIPLGVRRVCICDPCVCAIYIITSQYAEI